MQLLPGDRARRRVRRDLDWRPNGPIKRFFRQQGLADFLKHSFDHPEESLEFARGMLHQKRGVGLLLGTRGWELPAFQKLRQRVPSRTGA